MMQVLGDRWRTLWVLLFAVFALSVLGAPTNAAEVAAGPTDYREKVRTLRPGDTLWLSPGIYRDGLNIHRLNGTLAAPIAIRGPGVSTRAVFLAKPERNTISIVDSSHVGLIDLDIVGAGSSVDAVKAEGHALFAHHITLERLRISGYDASQQNVGISTKCPAWNWIIRNNRIEGAGTGIYLGNSDGSAPFVRGVIDGNVVVGTRGYGMQIKHQLEWPEIVDAAGASGETIIRYNTFVKDRRSSTGKLARPNLLLGHWPLSGRGAADRYLVYGNLFLDNPTEALLQAEGNLVAYNNVFINRFGDAVAIREHNDVPKAVDVFRNTILARGIGLLLRNADPLATQTVEANVIFGSIEAPESLLALNLVRLLGNSRQFLRRPDGDDGSVDLAPIGPLLDDRHWRSNGRARLPDVDLDFDRNPRSRATMGAYAPDAATRQQRFLLSNSFSFEER
jgi:hypothetical protein